KFNDGSLAKFSVENEGVDSQNAEQQITKFVKEAEAELNKGNAFDMFDLGSLYKDKDGNIAFKMTGKGAATDDQPAEVKKAEPAKKTTKAADDKKEKADEEAKKKAAEEEKKKTDASAKAAEEKKKSQVE